MNIFSKIAWRSMKLNRVRTVVTILGIILSTAMFTAVTTSVSSYMNYFSNYIEYRSGSWSYSLYNLQQKELKEYVSDEKVDSYAFLQNQGFAIAKGCTNPNKPYFCIEGLGGTDPDLLPIHLTEGRMPKDSTELVIAAHAQSNGEIDIEVGQTITLEVGKRMSDGMQLYNHTGFLGNGTTNPSSEDGEEEQEVEYLSELEEKTYTIVGICQRPSFEDYSAPGYTAITVEDTSDSEKYNFDLFLKLVNDGETWQVFQDVQKDHAGSMNMDYLRVHGNSGEANFNTVLYGFAAILIGIIVFGSIALIYNSFSISVNERMRLFGILSSVGATRKQLMKSVLTEGMMLGCVGIPLGILAGILGMMVTFYFVGENISQLLYESYPVKFSMHPSFPAILFAVIISMATILISAYIPMHKAMKTSVIDIIRQSREIKIRNRQVKTSKLTQRLFGFEGVLATKNYKRNRRKYRATIASLSVSIILFISASSFCSYLEKSVGAVYDDYGFDVLLHEQRDLTQDGNVTGLLEAIRRMKEVTDVKCVLTMNTDLVVAKSGMEQQITEYFCLGEEYPDMTEYSAPAQMIFLEDGLFRSFAESQLLKADDYFDKQNPRALIYDRIDYYSNRYYTNWAISDLKKANLRLAIVREQAGKYYGLGLAEDGSLKAYFEDGENPQDVRQVMLEEAADMVPIEGNIVRTLPDGIYTGRKGLCILLVYPQIQLEYFTANYADGYENLWIHNMGVNYSIVTEDDKATVDKLKSVERENSDYLSYYISNYKESAEEERATILVINVFSYGFIILISLIALANVFNTISTNIQLRSRELAMLRSVGMSPKGMQRMMNYECMLYGLKGIMYGLPVSIVLTYLIWRVTVNGVWMEFFVPWYSIMIAVGSVFIVVFSTMLYAMHKISKENTIDALKED